MNPSDILKYGHLTVLRTLDGITADQAEVGGVCGVWSTREIMAHLASYEHLLIEVMSTILGHTDTPLMMQMSQPGYDFNDAQVEARNGKSYQEILDEYASAQARAMEMVPQIPPDKWRQAGTMPWYGMEYSLDDYIVYTSYGHKREHAAQIAVYKDTLK